ncbi:MAG: formylmethanofuran--tetrahydromethanopterin N-formyltransferase [Pirellulales bacterium]|nr:formylmethanofuran--tetrahydromethanopterin N-formyltransferase [Pirellulales bacterium]
MQLGSTRIDDTFAEAFRLRYARLVVTAHDDYWLNVAVQAFCGYATSIIACDAEAGVERRLTADETLDRRPGAAILVFGFAPEPLGKAIANRTGQCLMTCASSAVYDGLPDAADRVPLGKHLRFFGDGYQKSKLIDGRRYWRIPVMDGEFLVEDKLGVEKGVGGGNIIVQAAKLEPALAAVRRAIDAISAMPGVITPFPGGVARSGSKVGSRYKALKASTSDAFCPTLRGRVESRLHPETNHALEIVIDGVDETAVGQAMAAAMRAAAADDVVAISAGNYGGKLGKFHFHLRELLGRAAQDASSS